MHLGCVSVLALSKFAVAKAKPLAVAAISAACFACSSSDVANGTGSNAGESEIASNEVYVFAKDNAGKAYARAGARLWSLQHDSLALEWNGSTDEQGRIAVDTNALKNRFLEVSAGDSLSALKWIGHIAEKVNVTLDSSLKLSGHISKSGKVLKNTNIKLLDRDVKTDASGNFEFENVPVGVYYAFVETATGVHSFQVEAGVFNTLEIVEEDFILVENFENWSRRRTILGQTFGEGWWFLSTDSAQGGKSRSNAGVWDDEILTKDGAYSGSSFHVILDMDETFDTRYISSGFTLGNDFFYVNDTVPSFYDLSAMKAITFYAKGNNSIYLQLTCMDENGDQAFYSVPVELTDEWQKFTVTPAEFEARNAGATFDHVNSINFVATEDVEFYLDNIGIVGISATDWPNLGR